LRDERELQRSLEEAYRLGEANADALRLAKNWCSHLEAERARMAGVGIPEQMTGLPISPREFRCEYAERPTTVFSRAMDAVLDFYDTNCVGCEHRIPVRIPNLLLLVEARDEARREQERASAAADRARRDALDARDVRRRAVIEGGEEVQKGLVELIQGLDHDADGDKSRRLAEAAKASPASFSEPLRDLLYDLVNAGGMARVEGALGALKAVEPDQATLATVASAVVARGGAPRMAIQLVGSMAALLSTEEMRPCLNGIMHLAAPVPPMVFSSSGSSPDTRPLLSVFQSHRALVIEHVVRGLRGGSPWHRRNRAHAAETLIPTDPSLVSEFVPDLIRSALLEDDQNSHPRAAAEMAICAALDAAPEVVDRVVRSTESRSDAQTRALLFGVFERYLRFSERATGQGGLEVSVRHLVEAFSAPEETDRLGEAARCIERVSWRHTDLLGAHAEQLLGAAALIAERLDFEPASDAALIETMAPLEKTFEDMNRHQAWAHALREIVSALSRMMPRLPKEVGAPLLETFESLEDRHDRLKAALVRGMGDTGAQRDGLRIAMPGLYVGLMHQSTLVRAAAAEAYGKVSRKYSEDIPDLAHEAFLLLLQDPYVIVHKAAVRALDRGRAAYALRRRFAALVGHLVVLYRGNRKDDAFLSKAIDVFAGLVGPEGLTESTVSYLLETLSEIDPNYAWDTLRFFPRRFGHQPGFTDAIVSLLANSATYPFYLDDVAEQLEDVPETELARVAPRIVEIASAVRDRAYGEGNPTLHLLTSLTQADQWAHAKAVLTRWRDEDRRLDWPGASEDVERMLASVEVEGAVAAGDRRALREALDAWSRLLESQSRADFAYTSFVPAFQLRVQALYELIEAPESLDETGAALVTRGDELKSISAEIEGATGHQYAAFGELLVACGMLSKWRAAVRAAERDSHRFLLAAQQRAEAVLNAPEGVKLPPRLGSVARDVERIDQPREVPAVQAALLASPLALPLKHHRSMPRRGGRAATPAPVPTRAPPPVAVVQFALDETPLESDILIQPEVMHDLAVRLELAHWPAGATEILLEPVSVEPPAVFDLPTFRIPAPDALEATRFADSGRLILRLRQTLRSRPLEFVYRATALLADGREMPVHLEGQRRFTIRSYDPHTQPVTGNPEADVRLLELTTELRRVRNLSAADRDDFMLIMAELARIAGESLASNLFDSSDWDEKAWQDQVWRELRTNPVIGSELEKHPHIAGGITDLSFHRLRIELKVERERLVTVDDARGFMQQTVQYVVGSHKRLGVLAILDVSPKADAPGALSNSILLHSVPDPGGGRVDIAIGTVIVRGNLSRPSDLSR
jgi:hypothetical protein